MTSLTCGGGSPIGVRGRVDLWTRSALNWLLVVYRVTVSPHLGPACRFEPTCSRYAGEAIQRYGAVTGGWLGVKRICRCHPLGGHGYDPVPGAIE